MRQIHPHPAAWPGLFLFPRIPCTLEKAKNNQNEVSLAQSNWLQNQDLKIALEAQKFFPDIEAI